MQRLLLILALVLTLAALAGKSGKAQTGKDVPMAKLHQRLIALHEQYASHLAQRGGVAFRSADPLVRLIDNRVVVDVVASGSAEVLKADLVSLGMQNAVSFGHIVSGQLPISAIPAVAGLTSLRFAHPAAAMAGVGLVTSQGELAMKVDTARATFHVDGTGVKVGVLSDSFNCLGGAATDVSNGDLSPVTVLEEENGCSSGTDEGRAMLQIVHDIAPGASLSFASAFNGMASFAANIQALAAAGAKVITDDVFYFAEPFFQDGIIAQAVDSVVTSGVAYFALAGNDDRLAYDHAFVPGQAYTAGQIPSASGVGPFLGGIAHNFNQGGTEDDFQRVTVGPYTTLIVTFQWDSPFFSVGGVGTQNDVDIYFLDAAHTQVIRTLTTNNIVAGDPVEVGSIFNNGATPADLNIMIVNRVGPNPGRIKYKIFQSPSVTIQEYATNSGTISGHQNAGGAEAVGAAAYFNTPAFGVSPPVKESYSSSGTTPILFDLAGNRLVVPDLRADKPEIVAPDGTDTTFFGSFDFDGTGFPNFFGTSAAVPHAAGVAALLLQAKPALSPAKLYTTLESTALDMGTPGFDNDSGFGLIQADAALVAPLPVSCPDESLQNAINGVIPGVTISVSGVCSENILMRNEKQRITIDGGGVTTVNGLSNSSPTFNIRGKGILVQNFTITGGSIGIEVNRGSNAVINNNVIQNAAKSGVVVDQLAFSVITNNTIENNPEAGILVDGSSTARIGFNHDTETTASPNTIQNNAIGIGVMNRSSVRVVGNNISNNTVGGVMVIRDSQADLASNTISGNGGDGVRVEENSMVQFGEDTGSTIYDQPNSTTVANAGFGISCEWGGVANGALGSLTGTGGQVNFDSSCISDLSP